MKRSLESGKGPFIGYMTTTYAIREMGSLIDAIVPMSAKVKGFGTVSR